MSRNIILIICGLAACGLLIWLVCWCIDEFGLSYEEYTSEANVASLDFVEAWTEIYHTTESYTQDGETHSRLVTKTRRHPAQYNITLEYKGETYKFNRESKFNELKDKPKCFVIVHDGYDKEGNLKNTYITLD